jgi:predicted Zn-dependent protease
MGENFGLCRIHEFEADQIELIIMAEAEFNPQHILDFMTTGVGREEEYWRRKEAPPEFLRKHPSVRNPLLTGEEKLTDLPGKESFSRPSKKFCPKLKKSSKSQKHFSVGSMTGTKYAKRYCGDAICGFSRFM